VKVQVIDEITSNEELNNKTQTLITPAPLAATTNTFAWALAQKEGIKVKPPAEQIQAHMKIQQAIRDEEQRKQRVIIVGLSEKKDEKENELNDKVKHLFQTIGKDEVKPTLIRRFKRKPDNKSPLPMPVIVTLPKSVNRLDIIKAAANKRKNNSDYDKVYINPDLNEQEQKEEKAIRDLLKRHQPSAQMNADYYYKILYVKEAKRKGIVKANKSTHAIIGDPLFPQY
jgi:hypothetical protein